MTNEAIAPVETQAPQHVDLPKMYTEADVHKLKQEVSDQAFRAGYGKGKGEVIPQQPPQPQMQPQPIDQNQMQPMQTAGVAQQPPMQQQQAPMPQEQLIDQRIQQAEMMRQQNQETQRRLAHLDAQFEQNKSKYPENYLDTIKEAGFEKHVGALGAVMDDAIPNQDALLYHLAQNPDKKFLLDNMAKQDAYNQSRGTPTNDSAKMARIMAQSLKVNDAADNLPQTREPLSQLTPSSPSVGRGGPMSVADYKAAHKPRW